MVNIITTCRHKDTWMTQRWMALSPRVGLHIDFFKGDAKWSQGWCSSPHKLRSRMKVMLAMHIYSNIYTHLYSLLASYLTYMVCEHLWTIECLKWTITVNLWIVEKKPLHRGDE
jgi:hypothetical protein